MKCPKCGYNSFEYHSICKKCSGDLGAYKMTHNITPIVLPPGVKEEKAAEFRSASSTSEQPVESAETQKHMFSFDLPEEGEAFAPAPQLDDPFSFDDDIPESGLQESKTTGGGFANILESTSLADDDSFSFSDDSPASTAKSENSTSGPGEFDLENFSWDDTPAATGSSSGQAASDDFDTLFGDITDSEKK